jgi:MmyB-like transcription regulator ligand binding domain
VQRLLDAMTDAPAFVRNGRLDILAANRLAQALYAPAFDTPTRPVNLDKALTDLVGELATRSEDFRTGWAAHNVRLHHTGVKHFRHPVVGDLDLAFEAMPLPADPGLAMTAYGAEPGTAAQDTLRFLASWAATVEPAESTRTAHRT